MKAIALVLALTVLPPDIAGAQCCGDCNGDGEVSINELVIAVDKALNGCVAPTPTNTVPAPTSTPRPTATATPGNRCPFTFTNSGNGLCSFLGSYNRGCGSQLGSAFSSTGSVLLVAIDTMLLNPPVVFFVAQVTGPTTANLTFWSTDLNLQILNPTAGTIQLTDNGSQLVIFPNNPPFMITGCNFVQYIGTITGHAGRSRVAAELLDPQTSSAFDRLRAWIERPPPELADF